MRGLGVSDLTDKVYLKHLVTQDDVTQKSIPINDLIYGVTRPLS